MSVSSVVNVFSDGRRYPQLPVGMEAFFAQGSVTGDATAGNVTINFRIHPSTDDNFTKYVALYDVSIYGRVAALTTDVMVRTKNAEWEQTEDAGFGRVVDTLNPLVVASANDLAADAPVIHYLGRTLKGTSGTIEVICLNVNTAVLECTIAGVWSDRPFIPTERWRL